MDAVYFSQLLVNKKGPLSRVWLAAHWDKKLTKANIFEISIESSVEGILQPKPWKMALRTTGHLLLGVVRIYSRKAKYLLADCNEAFVKIKMAFRPGVVDLPEGNREASLAAITLPEVFHDFENIGDMTIEVNATTNSLHQCRAEEITIKEDYGPSSFMLEDGFADVEFNDPDMIQNATNIDEGFDDTGLVISHEAELFKDKSPPAENIIDNDNDDMNKDKTSNDLEPPQECGLFETGLFEETPAGPLPTVEKPLSDPIPDSIPPPKDGDVSDDDDDDGLYGDFGPPSVGAPSGPSSPGSVAPPTLNDDMQTIIEPPETFTINQVTAVEEETIPAEIDQTTLIQNDAEAFALAPLDTTNYRGMERTRSKRKRKLIVDEVKNISGEEMKNQLSDCRDIITTLDLAPPTKKLMHWKETGGVEKLFALPGHVIHSNMLSRLYMRHLTTRPIENEDLDSGFLDFEDIGGKENVVSERAAKRLRVEEPVSAKESSDPIIDMDQATQPLPEYSTMSEKDAENEQPILKSVVTPPRPIDFEDSQTLPAENVSQLLVVPGVLEPVENSITEGETTQQEISAKESALEITADVEISKESGIGTSMEVTNQTIRSEADDLFDSLKENQREITTVEENQEKSDQNQILPLEDDDDICNPGSVGPPEEQLADETYEQFEERVHSKRASLLLNVLKRNLDAGFTVPFSAIVRGNKRKQAAQKFYTCLVLKKQQAIEIEQAKAYDEVYIKMGPNYNDMFGS